ncbi:MAG: hypothetical protein ABII22_04520 [Candidatus Micrarchaeota archaeon]
MKLIELIDKYIETGAKVFVNGMPDEEGGRILKREDDFIRFELAKKAAKQEDSTKETIIIPLSQIMAISQGERKAGTLAGTQSNS